MCLVADGTKLAERKIVNVLFADPGIGVVRHADAGYEQAKKIANLGSQCSTRPLVSEGTGGPGRIRTGDPCRGKGFPSLPVTVAKRSTAAYQPCAPPS
jgi:hypothetical protein